MPTLLLFASIREAAGCRRLELEGDSVGDVVDRATLIFGADFESLLPYCSVMVNGVRQGRETVVSASDEVALVPPVSGGQ